MPERRALSVLSPLKLTAIGGFVAQQGSDLFIGREVTEWDGMPGSTVSIGDISIDGEFLEPPDA